MTNVLGVAVFVAFTATQTGVALGYLTADLVTATERAAQEGPDTGSGGGGGR